MERVIIQACVIYGAFTRSKNYIQMNCVIFRPPLPPPLNLQPRKESLTLNQQNKLSLRKKKTNKQKDVRETGRIRIRTLPFAFLTRTFTEKSKNDNIYNMVFFFHMQLRSWELESHRSQKVTLNSMKEPPANQRTPYRASRVLSNTHTHPHITHTHL